MLCANLIHSDPVINILILTHTDNKQRLVLDRLQSEDTDMSKVRENMFNQTNKV